MTPPPPFADRVDARVRETGSPVCLGIDPRPEGHPWTHPERHDGDPARVARSVVEYFRAIVQRCHPRLAAVKPQSAFFERLGVPGLIALAQVVADARSLGLPVVLDAKRGDIGSTAEAYADAYLGDGVFGADALTVNPWLGFDTLEPFVRACDRNGRGLFVVVRTSNPGSGDLQEAPIEGRPLWTRIAERLERLSAERRGASGYGPVGAVVGATAGAAVAEMRALLPHGLLLVPGYGAQGGDAAAAAAALHPGGGGALVSASRSLTYLTDAPDLDAVADAAWRAVEAMRGALADALEQRSD